MNLYIETENNLPKNHPALEENLIQAFGDIPKHWVPFTRVEHPFIDVYEIYEGVSYELFGDYYTDVHHIRQMTDDEKLDKQTAVITAWNNYYPSWVFNEDNCCFEPPIPHPQNGKYYQWDEPSVSWKEQTPVVQLP